MKQCPQCHRNYADDLRFCLDDGAVLLAHQNYEATQVSPAPVPPAPMPRQRQGRKVVGVML
ncbi:MAG TPA: hypothetical protein VN920_03855, partial [Pyrinomonadaceae bacterium]|nr:hypothetical protein [Pyrinomonadaceae bacterium]